MRGSSQRQSGPGTDGLAGAMLHAASLGALPRIQHAFFSRAGGVSQGIYASLNGGVGSHDDPRHVADNRARMAAALGVRSEHLVTAYQVHSPRAVIVEEPWALDQRPRADALVTCRPGMAIAVTTADCGPILLADAGARVVAAAHAGWRGAAGGILEATILAMEECGARRQSIVAALGPMIRQPSYEVGPEFISALQAQDAGNARFFAPATRAGHALFDLAGYIAARLAAAGIGHIEDLGHCTYADASRFFSYRRATHRGESDYGRHINAIALAG
jgi:purine-nucleoside/S-methyl-5'-thioadenosine phosphorylase / adenosine deaminase